MDISTMKHMDAVNVLRATKQHVNLVVLRRPTGVSYMHLSSILDGTFLPPPLPPSFLSTDMSV